MTPGTAIRELAAGHRHERALGPLNDFQIADHEAGIERDRAEGLQPLVRVVHQLDAYFRNFHGRPPCRGRFRVLKSTVVPRRTPHSGDLRRKPLHLSKSDYGRLWRPTRVRRAARRRLARTVPDGGSGTGRSTRSRCRSSGSPSTGRFENTDLSSYTSGFNCFGRLFQARCAKIGPRVRSAPAQGARRVRRTLCFCCRDLAVLVDQRRRKARPGTGDHEVQSERHSKRLDDLAAPVTDGSRRPVDKEGHIASKLRCQPLKLECFQLQLPKSIQGHQRRGGIARPSGQARSSGNSLHQRDANSRVRRLRVREAVGPP